MNYMGKPSLRCLVIHNYRWNKIYSIGISNIIFNNNSYLNRSKIIIPQECIYRTTSNIPILGIIRTGYIVVT